MRNIAPMLETLGYDPDAYPPNYGSPEGNNDSLNNKKDNKRESMVHLEQNNDKANGNVYH